MILGFLRRLAIFNFNKRHGAFVQVILVVVFLWGAISRNNSNK